MLELSDMPRLYRLEIACPDVVDRIELELGIKPDRSTRGRFLYLMADRSPAEAVAYIREWAESR